MNEESPAPPREIRVRYSIVRGSTPVSAEPFAAEVMRRLAIATIVTIAVSAGAAYLFIRAPYRELSAKIAAAPKILQPEVLRAAFIAAEDPHDHSGATFTDQLVRYETTSRRRALARTAQAVLVRLVLDARFDDEQILAAYAESVYLGAGLNGVVRAAHHYFSKPPSELTIAEAATLAALVPSPHHYSPRTAPERALDRRNKVLREMRTQGWISDEQLRLAIAEPLHGRG